MPVPDPKPANRPRHTGSHLASVLVVAAAWGCQPTGEEGVAIAPRPHRAAVQVVAGNDFTCALLDDGQPRCWGFLPGFDEIGDDELINLAPAIAFDEDVVQLAAGSSHVCARLVSGGVRCWGADTGGSNGWGETMSFAEAKDRPALRLGGKATALATGRDHTCAVLDSGKVRCWGFGGRPVAGALHPSAADRRPEDLDPLELPAAATDVKASGATTCIELAEPPHQICLGSGGTNRVTWLSLRAVPGVDEETGLLRVRDFAVGALSEACLVDEPGRVRCWEAASARSIQPNWKEEAWVDDDGFITLSGPATMVTHGEWFACALLQDGSVHCWGRGGDRGALGRGQAVSGTQPPTKVDVGGPVRAIASGDEHSCALLESGAITCWGYNSDGQLGYGHTNTIGDDETPASAGPVPLG